eukprot:m.86482 g.86482  ORF g.86482 m.86482 type:complete len:53 (-) comp13058_c0_seq1:145-303(-)
MNIYIYIFVAKISLNSKVFQNANSINLECFSSNCTPNSQNVEFFDTFCIQKS